MRTALASPQTTRARIRDILCGAHQRTADLVAYVAAQVAADGLSTIDPATFGLLNEAAGTDVGSIASGSKVWTSPDDPWTAADVGKVAHVAGAGAVGVLVTRIASYQNAGQVTLADAASATVVADVNSAGGLGIWGWPGFLPDTASPISDAAGRILRSAVPLPGFPAASPAIIGAALPNVTAFSGGTYQSVIVQPFGGMVIPAGSLKAGSGIRLSMSAQVTNAGAGSMYLRQTLNGAIISGSPLITIPASASNWIMDIRITSICQIPGATPRFFSWFRVTVTDSGMALPSFDRNWFDSGYNAAVDASTLIDQMVGLQVNPGAAGSVAFSCRGGGIFERI